MVDDQPQFPIFDEDQDEKHDVPQKRPQPKKRHRWPTTLLIIVLAGVCAFSGYKVFTIIRGYQADLDAYDKLRQKTVSEQTSTLDPNEPAADPVADNTVDAQGHLIIDHAALLAQNDDYIGWIDIPDAKISYPVVNAKNYTQYLHKRFDGTVGFAGTPFTDYRCEKNFAGFNTIIYGHNMINGSMFAPLESYMDDGTFIKTHPDIYIYVSGSIRVYRIFAVCKTTIDSPAYQVDFEDKSELASWIKSLKADSKYKCDTDTSIVTQVLTLSTCRSGSDDNRLVLAAMLTDVIDQPVSTK